MDLYDTDVKKHLTENRTRIKQALMSELLPDQAEADQTPMSTETPQEAPAVVPSTTTSDETIDSAASQPASMDVETLDEAGYRNLTSNLESLLSQQQEPPQEAAQETPAEEPSQQQEDANPTVLAEDRLPERLRVGNWPEEERKALLLRQRNPDLSLAEALERVRVPADQGQVIQDEKEIPSLEATQEKIAELKAQRKAAFQNIELDKVPDLDEQIEEAQKTIEEIRVAQARAYEEETARFHADVDHSKARAVEYYPDVTDANSPLVLKMLEIDQVLKETGNPLYHSANKPEKLAQMAANELGIPPNAKKPTSSKATTQPSRAAVASQSTIRPATPIAPAAARTSRPSQAVISGTADELLDNVKDEDGLRALVASLAR